MRHLSHPCLLPETAIQKEIRLGQRRVCDPRKIRTIAEVNLRSMVIFLGAIAASLISLGSFSVVSEAQTTMPHMAKLQADKGVTVGYPDGWSLGQPSQNSWTIVNVPADKQQTTEPTVRVAIGYLDRPNHAEAVSQLLEYAKESRVNAKFLSIGGWPALERVQLIKRRQPGEGDDLEHKPGDKPRFPDLKIIQITTAIAAGNLLIRLEGTLPVDASQQLKDTVLSIGRSLVFSSTGDPVLVQQDVDRLNSTPRRPDTPRGEASAPETGGKAVSGPLAVGSPIFALQQLPNGTEGELEVAVSNDGKNVVVVKQSGWVTSNDGGASFLFGGGLNVSDGDSSIAFGQSGNFYHAALACFGSSCQPPCPGASPTGTPPSTNTCVEVATSNTSGRTFGALVNAAVCPNSGAGACSLDQEHIAADRVNAGSGGSDRVYAGVRNLNGTAGAFVTCSPDSNASWAPVFTLEGSSDWPRVTVGKDGSFYVVYEVGANIRIDKFNACTTSAAQMTRASASFPVTVSPFAKFAGCEVANGFGGLDRCNDGNTLAGPTVTVDDTNANHVYVAFSNNTSANNENVMVADSTDGGVTWRAPVVVNTSVGARRYHAWTCATGGNAYVGWYDRRAATVANNDLTDYYTASAGLSGGTLVANNDEFKISASSDAQCSLWPSAPRSTWDSENCSVQPQLAGVCKVLPPQTPDPSTNNRCDFSGSNGDVCGINPTTHTLETCTTGGGAVKYGDYNGNACTSGRLYSVFASSARLTQVQDFFQAFVVGSTPTTVTYLGATTGDYHDTVTLSGLLDLSGTSAGIGGQTLTFSIGTQSCPGMTNANGFASCNLTLNQIPGPYTVTAAFSTNGNYQGSSASTGFTITKEETTLSYTGAVDLQDGGKAKLSGVLLEDGTVPIIGRMVTFVLGSGLTMQSCTGTTNAAGVAACTVDPVAQPRGAGLVADVFAGDAYYLPSSASASTSVTGFPDAVRLTVKPNPAAVGQAVKLVAVVVAGPGLPKPPLPSTPTGSVTFYDLLTPLGTVALDGTATATLDLQFTSSGQHLITVKYSGDTIFVPSQATVKENVQ